MHHSVEPHSPERLTAKRSRWPFRMATDTSVRPRSSFGHFTGQECLGKGTIDCAWIYGNETEVGDGIKDAGQSPHSPTRSSNSQVDGAQVCRGSSFG